MVHLDLCCNKYKACCIEFTSCIRVILIPGPTGGLVWKTQNMPIAMTYRKLLCNRCFLVKMKSLDFRSIFLLLWYWWIICITFVRVVSRVSALKAIYFLCSWGYKVVSIKMSLYGSWGPGSLMQFLASNLDPRSLIETPCIEPDCALHTVSASGSGLPQAYLKRVPLPNFQGK
jgi:hypothetical protein